MAKIVHSVVLVKLVFFCIVCTHVNMESIIKLSLRFMLFSFFLNLTVKKYQIIIFVSVVNFFFLNVLIGERILKLTSIFVSTQPL